MNILAIFYLIELCLILPFDNLVNIFNITLNIVMILYHIFSKGKDVGEVSYYELKTFFSYTHLLAVYLVVRAMLINMFCLLC